MIGKIFGRLNVIAYAGKDKWGKNLWLCICSCGEDRILGQSILKTGNTKSCGCLKVDLIKKNAKYPVTDKRLYGAWYNMCARCYDENNKAYVNYGGRGIQVCPEWKDDYSNFLKWALANGYKSSLTIERIDVNGDYEPGNCAWVTRKDQANNRRNNRIVTFRGETKTLTQFCEEYNIKPDTFRDRIKRGWSFEDALTKPVRKFKEKSNESNN